MSPGTALVASFLVTLVRPATWPMALAAFLVRGGIVLVVAPIVVIPSAVGMANVVAPFVTSIVFGGPSTASLVVVAVAATAVAGWLVGGGLLAAAMEGEGIRVVAADEDVAGLGDGTGAPPPMTPPQAVLSPRREQGVARRILAVRLVALGPTFLALAWGATRLTAVAYRELTVPSETVTPVVLRVLLGAPEIVGIVLVAWLIGEAVGALATRRVVLLADGVRPALTGAARAVVRAPLPALIVELVPLAALALVLAPSALAAAAAWTALRAALATGAGPLAVVVLVAAVVGLWVGGLALGAVVSAWRAAAWTVLAAGTFGVLPNGRQGDWPADPGSGTLTDLRPHGADHDPR